MCLFVVHIKTHHILPATFGEFSQEDTEVTPEEAAPANPTEVVESDPAVMAWSAGPAVVPAEEPVQQDPVGCKFLFGSFD